MKLFSITFPWKGRKEEPELYYRGELTESGAEGGLRLHLGEQVQFDTYFNSFSWEKYSQYTEAKGISLFLKTKGELRLSLWLRTEQGEQELVFCQTKSDREEESVLRVPETIKPQGLLYGKIEAVGDGRVYGGYFSCENTEYRRVACGIILCTYKREEYVRQNIQYLRSAQDGLDDWESFDWLIVDNGGTLWEEFPESFIQVFQNRNLGGSGGFARGMLEAVRSKKNYTHLLVMDDDILFRIESLEKLLHFLQLLKPEYEELCIGGSMLELDKPYQQFEAGGYFEGSRQVGIHSGMDLRKAENVYANEKVVRPAQYNGWWFFCMPSTYCRREQFPLPLFLKYDDVEYGLRCGIQCISLNGIGVWHESFQKKYSLVLEYYNRRNFLILQALCLEPISSWSFAGTMFREILARLLRQQYTVGEYWLKAYRDFLKGPSFLEEIDAEKLHRSLLQETQPLLSGKELEDLKNLSEEIQSFTVSKKTLGQLLTLNGHLLPRWCSKKGWKTANIFASNLQSSYRTEQVLYVDEEYSIGYLTKRHRKRFLSQLSRLFLLTVQAFWKYHSVRDAFRFQHSFLFSSSFWKKKLGIKD